MCFRAAYQCVRFLGPLDFLQSLTMRLKECSFHVNVIFSSDIFIAYVFKILDPKFNIIFNSSFFWGEKLFFLFHVSFWVAYNYFNNIS